MTVSTETVRMAKSRPGKNQSEYSDLPYHKIILNTINYNNNSHKSNNKGLLYAPYVVNSSHQSKPSFVPFHKQKDNCRPVL